jgi:4a-hydroxytetrahydrobiopterin dehydratase
MRKWTRISGPLAIFSSSNMSRILEMPYAFQPMTRPTKLNESELASILSTLAEWTVDDGKLHREYLFADFVTAFGFMTSVALAAQAVNHHPEWSNGWNRVRIDLTTDDVGGITQLDVELARSIEELARHQLTP